MMIDLQKIKSLGVGSKLIKFTKFLIEEKGERTFPDYRKLNLMKVPELIPNTRVIDFRNGIDDGLLYHFSGTKIDDHYGYNVTGHTMEECYTGNYPIELFRDVYRKVYLEKKTGFTSRYDVFKIGTEESKRKIESLLFPCSEDDQNINFGIGITIFELEFEEFEPIFMVL